MIITKERIRKIVQEELQKLVPTFKEAEDAGDPKESGRRVQRLIGVLQKHGFEKAGVDIGSTQILAQGMIQLVLTELYTLKALMKIAWQHVLYSPNVKPEDVKGRSKLTRLVGERFKEWARKARE
tara:strand:- start:1 stop:375 length:375 start_codon:yes stop_codon:yes gene_type:complete